MGTKKLSELAGTIRSKDAGVNMITFDIIFGNSETYEKVKKKRHYYPRKHGRTFQPEAGTDLSFCRI